MLVSLSMLSAALLLAALLPLHRAIAVVGTCVLLALYPIPSLVATASMGAAYLLLSIFRKKPRNGLRRQHRSRY
jgi:hypothetical protein